MKIRKRRQPLDFGALAAQGDPPYEAESREAPDLELGPADTLLEPPDFDFAPADPPEPVDEPVARILRRTPPIAISAEPEPERFQAQATESRPAPERIIQASPRTAARPSRRSHAAPVAQRPAGGLPPAWPIYLVAFLVSAIWAAAPIGFAWAYKRDIAPFQEDLFGLAVFALLAAGPCVLVWVAAYLVRQGQRLAVEAGRARSLADEMVSPAMMASGEAAGVVQAVREEIDRAGQAANEARESLLALRHALAAETERLAEAAATSARTAVELADTLSRERGEMAGFAQTLDAQSLAVADAITRQARMVAEASDLAETQLREAEASLAARAADLTAVAGETGDMARTAGEDLTRHIARLEAAGMGVAEQIGMVEGGLSEQRAALVGTVHGLRADQETFAAEAETQTAKLAEFISDARLSAAEMGDRAIKGADALQRLIAEATGHFRDFADNARAEREEFGLSSAQSLQALSETAAQERAKLEEQTRAAIVAMAQAAEETRAATERHADAARAQVDQLSEAAFTAGQKANQVFEARLDEARTLIERSAQMVEEAGAASARKLDDGAAAARATLEELERMLGEIEARASRLPTAAREQAEAVRAAVAESMDGLMAQARRTAEETEAIDFAFQERVRRNYDMLSEAVRLMGAVASGPAAAPLTLRDRAPPRAPAAAPPPPAASAPDEDELELDQPVAPPPRPKGREAPEFGLRPRLRLTPTATDEEFTNVFEAAGGPAAEPGEIGEAWTWKELLSSIDDEGGGGSGLNEDLAAEIAGMGIDPAALLPKARLNEIAASIEAGEREAARDVVRRLAPAGVRRLTRRLFTDRMLKERAQGFLARYQGLVAQATGRERGALAELLATETGRAFLLFDAAANDLD